LEEQEKVRERYLVSDNWEVQQCLLELFLVVGISETGVNTAEIGRKVLAKWNLRLEQIVVLMFDGRPNVRKCALQCLKVPWHHCLTH
jgi:hypothetical protein